MTKSNAYPTGDTLAVDGVALYLRTAHYNIGRQGIIYVGDDIWSTVAYRAREIEFCTEFCYTCREILRWANGSRAVYELERIVVVVDECTHPKK